MGWVIFVAGAVLSWGAYGALLHMGTDATRQPAESACLCVGVAYFLIGVIIPVGALSAQGNLSDSTRRDSVTATIAGALGAAGAACIIWAFKTGGLPVYVMPLVFAARTAGQRPGHRWRFIHPRPRSTRCSMLDSCCVSGAGMVLYFRPTA
jgi:hypothetical protein